MAILIAIAAIAVLAGGSIAAITADALAKQTGIGASFVGFVLGGIVTSLPEVSSTIGAVRLKRYEMAYADAYGTNLFSLFLLFVVDLFYPRGPVLNEAGRFSHFAVLLGICVTTVSLSGLIARPKRHILRMGLDSLLIVAISSVGFLLLYKIQ
jgi:cation:H+ antiporter